ncbi:MAG: flagellar hook-basal body complex protein [Bacillota bacterium]
MLRSMYSGISGLGTHQAGMDVVGNNIANVNTLGFKAGNAQFKSSLYQTTASSSAGTAVIGGTNAAQMGYGSQIGTIDLQHSNGIYTPSVYGSDVMIDGDGFFIVGPKPTMDEDAPDGEFYYDLDFLVNWDPSSGDVNGGLEIGDKTDDDGASGTTTGDMEAFMSTVYLTRVGDFAFDSDGFLCDGQGNVVYGQALGGYADGEEFDLLSGFSAVMQPIRLPANEPYEGSVYTAERIVCSNLTIDNAGKVLINDENGELVQIGLLAIAAVQNPTGLTQTSGPYYTVGGNSGVARPQAAGFNSTGTLINYGLESSNVDLSKEFSNMITTQRGFQACAKMITVSDEMLQELVNLKR